jgi:hypothetical protein
VPKATINTASGAVVTIEGTQDEVAGLLARLEREPDRQVSGRTPRSESTGRPTPAGLLSELIDDDFFNQPRELGAVRFALQEKGHFYPVTTLSPLLLRSVRKKELRRIKDQKHWTYVR